MESAKKYIQSLCGGLILMCMAAAPVHAVVQTAIFDGSVDFILGDLSGTVLNGLVEGDAFGGATSFDDVNVDPTGGTQFIGYESLDIFFGNGYSTDISTTFTDPNDPTLQMENVLRFFDDQLVDIIARDFIDTNLRLIFGTQSLTWAIFDTSSTEFFPDGDIVVLGNVVLNPGGAGQPVPLPAALPLLLSALGIFGLVNRRERGMNPA